MNKTQAILEYLKAGNKINDKIGVEKFYTYRLSGIIYNLRKLYGYNIIAEWQENKETGARYVDYYLIPDKKEEKKSVLQKLQKLFGKA